MVDYRPRSMKWALVHEDWSDLTIEQIAEVFGVEKSTIRTCISKVKKDGHEVKYKHSKPGRKQSDGQLL